MARESNFGRKPYGRRKVRSECKGSDESDEDYMVDENECDESEDEYSSFAGDESEEILGECEYEEEDDEEELERKKVKKVARQREPQRKKNRAVKPRKRKRVSYREDDDEDYDDDDNDEDFKPDEVYGVDDDDVELPVTKGNKKLGRARLHKDISKGEEDDEEDELPMAKGNKKWGKPQLRKSIAKGEEEEEDDDDVEFTLDEVYGADEDEDELPMTKRNKKVGKSRLHKGIAKGEEEEEDDVEFTLDEVDGADEDELPMTKRNKKVGKSRLHKGIAKGEEEEEDDVEFTLDEVDGADEDELPMTKRNKKVGKSRLHKGTAKGEEEEDDDDEFTLDEVDGADEDEDEFPKTKRNKRVGKSQLHKGIAKGEDDDDDDDEEFTPDEVDCADDEEDEFPMTKRNKKLGKTQLHNGISKGEEDDDVGFASDEVDEVDGVDEEDELPMEMGYGKLGKSRLRKGIAKGEEYDDDDNDDDYEFTPDEVDDLEDEEDELPKMKGGRKLHKGIAKGEQSKTTSKVSKKIKRGKSRNKCGVKKKERVDEKGKINDMSSLEAKNKIIVEGRRNKRLIVHSDSDSVSSGPLDYEYTISEEEREQVREATEFCGGLTGSWRCPAISKNLMEKETPRLQKKRSKRKDKEKVEEWKTEAGKQVCGICLSEEGKRRVRGTLNCCSHYFCFACIMEWSKVESRCPLCKQRFVTISKPAKSNAGFDLRTVVIQVPERDQVYQPSEEELRGYLDPYENVICTECQQGGDDALMLLCDLCDSPAHTYCVGLGHEVPEGNWYCEGCRPTALETQQNLNLTPENRTSNNFSVGSSPVTNVRETFDLNEMYVPEAPLTQEACHVPSPRIGQAALSASGSVASTVSDRRRIQRQIHQILINNGRMRQIDNRTTGAMTSVTGNYLFGSQIGQIRELAPQPVVAALERAPRTFLHGRRLQENMNAFATTSSHLNEQSIQNQPSTSVQSSFSGLFQGEFGAVNSDIGSGLVHQQLHPCSSRPNIVPDASTSPYQFREATVPSRTWHGGYNHHFS
ncbi:PREDICTED: uncharacterized protein LOC109155376 isoform X2 [Ipomoea nil]|uniref:uncharacterized protein LOC109155376 isoform X2 n=1 Tax=Ipomoea nil TaxID=35883 RepID=UPI0009009900|nr:PREDICTED: uncharacterized protein LOC109155376 isoform X2 [Ipomoea nil]